MDFNAWTNLGSPGRRSDSEQANKTDNERLNQDFSRFDHNASAKDDTNLSDMFSCGPLDNHPTRLAPSTLFDWGSQGPSQIEQDQLLWGDDMMTFNPQVPLEMAQMTEDTVPMAERQSSLAGIDTSSNDNPRALHNQQHQPAVLGGAVPFGLGGAASELGDSTMIGHATNDGLNMGMIQSLGIVPGPAMGFMESLYSESPADNSSHSSVSAELGTFPDSASLHSFGLSASSAAAAAAEAAAVGAESSNPAASKKSRTHKRDFSETITMKHPLVPSSHNDDYDAGTLGNAGYYPVEPPNIQTPIRGGVRGNMANFHGGAPIGHMDQQSIGTSPTYLMHGLQSPLESPALQSPNPGLNYSHGTPNAMRRLHSMMTSPRMQRSMSSASQINSPMLGDIAEAPSETGPQTPRARNGGVSKSRHRKSASISATPKQYTPQMAAASAMASTTTPGMHMGSGMSEHQAASAAAAVSMGLVPVNYGPAGHGRNGSISNMDAPPYLGNDLAASISATNGEAISPSRNKRESRRRVTQDQIDRLEEAYAKNQRPETDDREQLAAAINLDVREVTSWFHKKRLKDRAQASATEGPLKPGKQKAEKPRSPPSRTPSSVLKATPSTAAAAASVALTSPSSPGSKPYWNTASLDDMHSHGNDSSTPRSTSGDASFARPITGQGTNGPSPLRNAFGAHQMEYAGVRPRSYSAVPATSELGAPIGNLRNDRIGFPHLVPSRSSGGSSGNAHHNEHDKNDDNDAVRSNNRINSQDPSQHDFGMMFQTMNRNANTLHARNMSTGSLPLNTTKIDEMPHLEGSGHSRRMRNSSAHSGMMRSSSSGYHQQLTPFGTSSQSQQETQGGTYEKRDVNDTEKPDMKKLQQQYLQGTQQFPQQQLQYQQQQSHQFPQAIGSSMSAMTAPYEAMSGTDATRWNSAYLFGTVNGSADNSSPNTRGRSKRRSAQSRTAQASRDASVDEDITPGGSNVFMNFGNYSSGALNGLNQSRHRSHSIQEVSDGMRFDPSTGNNTPLGQPSRSNSLASINSVSMFPPTQESTVMESRQGSPESRSPLRWPSHYALSRSQSSVSVNTVNMGSQPPFTGDMKRRRSLFGNVVSMRPPENDSNQNTRAPLSRANSSGSLASSAAAAALRSSNRISSQPGTRSRQSSLRLQLEEANHSAHLVVYNDDPQAKPRSQGQSLEEHHRERDMLEQKRQSEDQQDQQDQQTHPERQLPPRNFNVSQAIQRLSSLRQLSPSRNDGFSQNGDASRESS